MAWSESAVVAVKDLSATTLDVASTGDVFGIFQTFLIRGIAVAVACCVQLGSLLAGVDVVQRMS